MYPIILAHGIARFDILRQKLSADLGIPPNDVDDRLQYFRNIRTHLRDQGFESVFNTDVEFAGSLVIRSEQLKARVEDVLRKTDADKVHIIGHSMGGLDARRMIVDLGMADRVASLTTIGTPHLGTVLADRVFAVGGGVLLRLLENSFNTDLDGFRDLTTRSCADFNTRAEDSEATNSVVYRTYSSWQRAENVFLPLLAPWFAIDRIEGRNDGLVPVRSQSWKSELIAADGSRKSVSQSAFPFEADHLNQVGWWDWEEAISPLFGMSYRDQRDSYEAAVKAVYLQIAQDISAIV